MKHYVAIDLGATSGRVILASVSEDRKVQMETVHRFPTPLVEKDGKYFWDIDNIFGNIIQGLSLWKRNILFCALAGLLWYSQFFGLSLGKGFLTEHPVLITFSWCILMALNVTFSNVWGIILKEWKGVSKNCFFFCKGTIKRMRDLARG